MATVYRNYQHQDFSYLMDEFKREKEIQENIQEVRPSKEEEVVDLDRRRRSSLMDNPKMRYAYSALNRVLHDRDCEHVKEIADKNFRMLPEFDGNMVICPTCCRKALIRQGIGDDGKRISAYEHFFRRADVSTRVLRRLFIEYKANVKWIDINTIELHINEDTWRVIQGENGLELWHNNYIRLDDNTRFFTQGFHRQTVHGTASFGLFLKIMTEYSWDSHIATMMAEKKSEELKNEDIIKTKTEREAVTTSNQKKPTLWKRLTMWLKKMAESVFNPHKPSRNQNHSSNDTL